MAQQCEREQGIFQTEPGKNVFPFIPVFTDYMAFLLYEKGA